MLEILRIKSNRVVVSAIYGFFLNKKIFTQDQDEGLFLPQKWKTYDAKFTSEQIPMRTYPFHLGLNSVLSVVSFLVPLVLPFVAGCCVSGMTTTEASHK